MKLYITAAMVGLILGIIASKYLFVGSWLSLVPWTTAGLVLAYFTRSHRQAIYIGATYGFVLLFFFMLSGYTGTDPIRSKIWFFAIIGAFGAVYGIVVTEAGHALFGLTKTHPNSPSVDKQA